MDVASTPKRSPHLKSSVRYRSLSWRIIFSTRVFFRALTTLKQCALLTTSFQSMQPYTSARPRLMRSDISDTVMAPELVRIMSGWV